MESETNILEARTIMPYNSKAEERGSAVMGK